MGLRDADPHRVQLPKHCDLLVNMSTSNRFGISIISIASSGGGGGGGRSSRGRSDNKREFIIVAFPAVAVVAS